MSRYIKLDDALQTLADTCYLDEIDKNMQELPSIDIVRCKECKHWHEYIDAKGQGRCDAEKQNPFRISVGTSYADFFCSYGERREP